MDHSLYSDRQERIRRAVALEPADRVPVIFTGTAFAPKHVGVSMAEFCADPDVRVNVTLDSMDRLGGFDGINSLPNGYITVVLTLAWLSRVAVPGRDLPADSLWQVVETEVMTAEDYDTIIEQGWWSFLQSYLPRVIDVGEVEKHLTWTEGNLRNVVQRFRERGYVPVSSGGTTIPFECLCGGRSMQEFFLDLHRCPEKVKAALDVMQPELVQLGLDAVRLSGVPATWVGGWRSASSMLSAKMWGEFVLPYYVDMVARLAEHDIVSVLHFDHDWTRDLARLRELPARRCILNLDGFTDIRRAKEVLGDHMAIMGDVPSTLLATGTPDEVYDYVRDLVRDIGPTGLLLCPGCDAPLNSKPENMQALAAAGAEFGAAR